VTETFLPFFSRGGGGILVCYIMMGIILSIYRYKNIYPKHVNTELGVARITIRL
jgi:cell division protein FtsW (lipid II flippase)